MKTASLLHHVVIALLAGLLCGANGLAQVADTKAAPVEAKMPDISGPWHSVGPTWFTGTAMIQRVDDESAHFVIEFPDMKATDWPRLKWSLESQSFEANLSDVEWASGTKATVRLHADGETLTFTTFFSGDAETKKRILKERNLTEEDWDKRKKEEWKRGEEPAGMFRSTPGQYETTTIVVTETKGGLAFFSKAVGKWSTLQLEPRADGTSLLNQVVSSQEIAVVLGDKALYAYAIPTARWAKLTFPKGYRGPANPIVDQTSASIRLVDKTYVFSSHTGEWSSPDSATPASEPSQGAATGDPKMPDISGTWRMGKDGAYADLIFSRSDDGDFEFVEILSGQTDDAFGPIPVRWSRSLRCFVGSVTVDSPPTDTVSDPIPATMKYRIRALSDGRTLDVVVTRSEGESKDVVTSHQKWIRRPEPSEIANAKSPSNPFKAIPNTPEAKQLLERLHAQESAAASEAELIRQLQANGPAEPNQRALAEHQRKLTNLLSTAFDLKLQLEELQVQELQSRLSQLDRQIGQRKQLREKIIARRATELIEGETLKWGANTSVTSNQLVGKSLENKVGTSVSTNIHVTGPKGIKITYDEIGAAPPKFGLSRDATKVRRAGLVLEHEPLLKDTAMRGWLDVFPSNAKSAKFLQEQSVPLTITENDIRAATQGVVTKFVYLPDIEAENPNSTSAEALVSTHFTVGTDMLKVASERGTILLVLRLAASFEDTRFRDAENGLISPPILKTDTGFGDDSAITQPAPKVP